MLTHRKFENANIEPTDYVIVKLTEPKDAVLGSLIGSVFERDTVRAELVLDDGGYPAIWGDEDAALKAFERFRGFDFGDEVCDVDYMIKRVMHLPRHIRDSYGLWGKRHVEI